VVNMEGTEYKENSHIRAYLKYYIRDEVNPSYAIMLKGSWGCGKTWFIKDLLKELEQTEKPESKANIYLSLYGIQNTKAIESKIFSQIYPILGSTALQQTGRIFKGAIKGHLKIDLDGHESNLDISVPSVDLKKILKKQNDVKVMIFDDFERCSISRVDLMGYFNQLVEHENLKVIIISDEDKILDYKNGDEGSDLTKYATIKEKVVGKTFEINPDVHSAVRTFISEIPDAKTKIQLTMSIDQIVKIYLISSLNNMRILRHALKDFGRLYLNLDKKIINKDGLMQDLIFGFLILSMCVKSGHVDKNNFYNFIDWMCGNLSSSQSIEIFEKFSYEKASIYNNNNPINLIDKELWERVIILNEFPDVEINENLLKSHYFDVVANWKKLWYGVDLSDEEFKLTLSSVQNEWDNNFYQEIGLILQVVSMFYFYAEFGLLSKSKDKITSDAKCYIDEFNKKIPIEFVSSYSDRNAYAGLGYYKPTEEPLKNIIDYVRQLGKDNLESGYKNIASNMLEIMSNNPQTFYNNMLLFNHSENKYYNTPLLQYIDVNDFYDRLILLKHVDRKTIAYTLQSRYEPVSFAIQLQPELRWIEDLIALIKIKITELSVSVNSTPY
jgi:hypothetical protein